MRPRAARLRPQVCSTHISQAANTPWACRLTRDGAPDIAALLRAALPMCETDFRALCEERALARKCGNPLCSAPVMPQPPAESAHIDWATLEMVKVSTDRYWCGAACQAKCVKLAKSLGSSFDRLDVLRRLRPPGAASPLPFCSHGTRSEHKQLDDATTLMTLTMPIPLSC